MKIVRAPDYLRRAFKSVTFTGAANLGASGDNVPIFDVTGRVLIRYLIPYCTVSLTEAAGTATISLGHTGAVASYIPATNSVELDATEFWVDTGPDAIWVAINSLLMEVVTLTDIIVACATQDTDGGTIEFVCYWLPLSADGNVAAA